MDRLEEEYGRLDTLKDAFKSCEADDELDRKIDKVIIKKMEGILESYEALQKSLQELYDCNSDREGRAWLIKYYE